MGSLVEPADSHSSYVVAAPIPVGGKRSSAGAFRSASDVAVAALCGMGESRIKEAPHGPSYDT